MREMLRACAGARVETLNPHLAPSKPVTHYCLHSRSPPLNYCWENPTQVSAWCIVIKTNGPQWALNYQVTFFFAYMQGRACVRARVCAVHYSWILVVCAGNRVRKPSTNLTNPASWNIRGK